MSSGSKKRGSAVILGVVLLMGISMTVVYYEQNFVIPDKIENKQYNSNKDLLYGVKQFDTAVEKASSMNISQSFLVKSSYNKGGGFLTRLNRQRFNKDSKLLIKSGEVEDIILSKKCSVNENVVNTQDSSIIKNSREQDDEVHSFSYSIDERVDGENINSIVIEYQEFIDVSNISVSDIRLIGIDRDNDGLVEEELGDDITSVCTLSESRGREENKCNEGEKEEKDGSMNKNKLKIKFNGNYKFDDDESILIKYSDVYNKGEEDKCNEGDDDKGHGNDCDGDDEDNPGNENKGKGEEEKPSEKSLVRVYSNGKYMESLNLKIDDKYCFDSKKKYNTVNYVFEPRYSEVQEPLIYSYEHGLIFSSDGNNREGSEKILWRLNDSMMDGKTVEIPLLVRGDRIVSNGGAARVKVSPDKGHFTHTITNTEKTSLVLNIPTEASEGEWRDILNEELKNGTIKSLEYIENNSVSSGGCSKYPMVACSSDGSTNRIKIRFANGDYNFKFYQVLVES